VDELLSQGYRVASCARRLSPELQQRAERLDGRTAFDEADLSDERDLEEVFDRLDQRWGRMDLLVNNAAIGQDGLLAHTNPEEVMRIIATDLVAPILLTRLAVRRMLLQPSGGHVINVSSICAHRGMPGVAVYTAAKAGLEGFTRAMAREVGGRGIRVNAVAPGFFASDMSSVLDPDSVGRIEHRTATGVSTTGRDVIAAVRYLLTPGLNVTGQTIVVDGGFSI